jgi:hypothetical protein
MRKPFVVLVALAALAACKAPPMKDYAYPKWGFVADFSAPPEATETPAKPGQMHSLLLESKAAGRDFVVAAWEGIRPDVTIDQIGPDLSGRAAKAMGGELGPETYASTGQGVLGREYAITRNGKPFATIRSFLANGRFYEVAAQSVLGPDDPAVKDYLALFRITSAPSAVAPPPANAATTNAG